jgi:uncharacterized protein
MCSKQQVEEIGKSISIFAKGLFADKLDSVILYGSYARGDYDAESDIDVMLLVNIDKDELPKFHWDTSKFASKISLEYEVLVSLSVQDSDTFNKYRDALPYYKNINLEGIKIYA